MNLRKITLEHLAYLLAFVLALGIRLLFLGTLPLSDPEADWALQAFSLAKGSQPLIGPQPAYVLLTGLLFSLVGNDNLLARFWPAVAGSLLVLAPYLTRSRLGSRAALVLAFGLALDPGLVALSRQAGGTTLAISCLVLAFVSWLDRKLVLTGIFAGLAVLGGPTVWGGLIGLGLACLAFRLSESRPPRLASGDLSDSVPSEQIVQAADYRKALLFFAGTALLVGTLFFQFPRGIGAAAGSLAAYFQGWGLNSGLPITTLLVGLVAYEPLALIFGVWGAVRGWVRRDPVDRFCSLWFAVALLLALAYPGRQMGDLAWAIVPIWALAARQFVRAPQVQGEDRSASWIYTGVVFLVMGFLWLNFTGFLVAWQSNPEGQQARILAISGGVILLVLATVLVAWGWSSRIAAHGLLRGVTAGLVIYTIANMTAASGLRIVPTLEYWGSYPQPSPAGVLQESIGELSLWRTGRKDMLDVVSVGIASPALRWSLRNMPNSRFTDQLAAGSQPSVVITAQEDEPALAASYRGESIPWLIEPDLQAMTPFDKISWIAYHRGPFIRTDLILWARTDLFPDVGGSQAVPGQ